MYVLFCAGLLPISVQATPRMETRSYGVEVWRLTIKTIQFSRDVTCRLYSKDRRSVYVSNALGLYAGRGYDVASSWFRLENGEAMRWRDQLPELARLRVAIDGRDMEQPTSGMVWLPLPIVKDAHRIDVATDRGTRLRSFNLRGFSELHAAARRLGCTPEGRFVR